MPQFENPPIDRGIASDPSGDAAYNPALVPAALLWSILTEDPDSWVGIADADGRIHFRNAPLDEALDERVRGRQARVHDLFSSREAGEAKVRFIRAVLAGGIPQSRLELMRGSLWRCWLGPLPAAPGSPACVLMVSRHARGDAPVEHYAAVVGAEERADRLGVLAALSPRELEVLAMIGRGLRSKEIANRLHRSIRTVHGHTAAISRKLGGVTRTEMVRIALAGGLAGGSGRPAN